MFPWKPKILLSYGFTLITYDSLILITIENTICVHPPGINNPFFQV